MGFNPRRRDKTVDHEALALLHNPEALAQVEMSPDLEKRLEKAAEYDAEAKKRWGAKLATRADMVHLMEVYIQEKILPMAYHVDLLAKQLQEMQEIVRTVLNQGLVNDEAGADAGLAAPSGQGEGTAGPVRDSGEAGDGLGGGHGSGVPGDAGTAGDSGPA